MSNLKHIHDMAGFRPILPGVYACLATLLAVQSYQMKNRR